MPWMPFLSLSAYYSTVKMHAANFSHPAAAASTGEGHAAAPATPGAPRGLALTGGGGPTQTNCGENWLRPAFLSDSPF